MTTKTKQEKTDLWNDLEAVGNCVIVREIDPEDKSEGGILLPTKSQEQPPEGVILSIGPLAFLDPSSGEFFKPEFAVGDRVVYLGHAGARVTMSRDITLKVLRVADVIAKRKR